MLLGLLIGGYGGLSGCSREPQPTKRLAQLLCAAGARDSLIRVSFVANFCQTKNGGKDTQHRKPPAKNTGHTAVVPGDLSCVPRKEVVVKTGISQQLPPKLKRNKQKHERKEQKQTRGYVDRLKGSCQPQVWCWRSWKESKVAEASLSISPKGISLKLGLRDLSTGVKGTNCEMVSKVQELGNK